MGKKRGFKDIINCYAYDNKQCCKKLIGIHKNLREVSNVLNGIGKCPK